MVWAGLAVREPLGPRTFFRVWILWYIVLMIEGKFPEEIVPESAESPKGQELFDHLGNRLGYLWEDPEALPPHVQEALQYASEMRAESSNELK